MNWSTTVPSAGRAGFAPHLDSRLTPAVTVAGMDRRLAGIVVLVVALVAVAVVPSVAGRRVAGSAVATVFPRPAGRRRLPADPVLGCSAIRGSPGNTLHRRNPFRFVRRHDRRRGGSGLAGRGLGQATTSRLAGPCTRRRPLSPAYDSPGVDRRPRRANPPERSAGNRPSASFPITWSGRSGRAGTAGWPAWRCRSDDRCTSARCGPRSPPDPCPQFGLCWSGEDIDRLPGPVLAVSRTSRNCWPPDSSGTGAQRLPS